MVALCVSQLHWRAYFSTPLFATPFAQSAAATAVLLLMPLGCWAAIAGSPDSLSLRAAAVGFSLFCAGYCEVLHAWVVDAQNDGKRFPRWNAESGPLQFDRFETFTFPGRIRPAAAK